jgi:hypothetical protein
MSPRDWGRTAAVLAWLSGIVLFILAQTFSDER